jgi:hypothetical protein
MSLGIGVNKQYPASVQRERCGDIYGRGGLPYSAFLIRDSDDQALLLGSNIGHKTERKEQDT